jgi:predicted outer membrane repeat protein
MKHLILAAGLTSGLALLAAPAFAGDAPKSDNKAVTFTDTQAAGSGGAIAQRHATLRRNAAARSDNARAAWRGSVHYY